MPERRFRRGIYLLPTMFTVGNLYCGYSSLIAAADGKFGRAAIFIVVAGILDALDGRIARLTGSTSDFGLHFDSLADIVSFGVAPAFLVFQWSSLPSGRAGLSFLFLVCVAMRLARFNLLATEGVPSKRHFVGLPSPPAAGVVATMVFAFPEPAGSPAVAVGQMVLVVTAGLLMVSRFRYRSFKEFDLRNRRSFVYILLIVAIVILIRTHPQATLLGVALIYAASGPLASTWGLITRSPAADGPAAPSPGPEGPS